MKTLEEIIEQEKLRRTEGGEFGIIACKESIEFAQTVLKQSLFSQLENLVKRANEDVYFNKHMVLACWELINEGGDQISNDDDDFSSDFLTKRIKRRDTPLEIPEGDVSVTHIYWAVTRFLSMCKGSKNNDDYLVRDMMLSEFIKAYSEIDFDFQSDE